MKIIVRDAEDNIVPLYYDGRIGILTDTFALSAKENDQFASKKATTLSMPDGRYFPVSVSSKKVIDCIFGHGRHEAVLDFTDSSGSAINAQMRLTHDPAMTVETSQPFKKLSRALI